SNLMTTRLPCTTGVLPSPNCMRICLSPRCFCHSSLPSMSVQSDHVESMDVAGLNQAARPMVGGTAHSDRDGTQDKDPIAPNDGGGEAPARDLDLPPDVLGLIPFDRRVGVLQQYRSNDHQAQPGQIDLNTTHPCPTTRLSDRSYQFSLGKRDEFILYLYERDSHTDSNSNDESKQTAEETHEARVEDWTHADDGTWWKRFGRGLASVARSPRLRCLRRARSACALERNGKSQLEGRPWRCRRFVPDCCRRSCVSDVADRRRSRPSGPASRAGGERGNRWRACPGFVVARRKRSNLLPCRGVQPHGRTPPLAASGRSGGPTADGSRQAQPRKPESGHRQSDGVRLVRNRPDRRPRREWQAGVGTESREGDRSVRNQLGTQQLSNALPGHTDSALRPRSGVVSAGRGQANREGPVESRSW